jgi:hypothetical protein
MDVPISRFAGARFVRGVRGDARALDDPVLSLNPYTGAVPIDFGPYRYGSDPIFWLNPTQTRGWSGFYIAC